MSTFNKGFYYKGCKTTKCLILMTSLISSLAFAGEWKVLKNAEEPFAVEVLQTDGNRTVLSYTVNKYLADEISIDGRVYTLLCRLPKESMIEEKGHPRLPRINRSIIIPDDGVMDYEILTASYTDITDVDIAPSKGHILRSRDPAGVPYTFSDVYHDDAFFPSELVNLREPYILRDYRGLVVELNSFQYNPVTCTLRIYTDVIVQVKKVSSGGKNTIRRQQPLEKIDPQFDKFYRRHFINQSGLDYPVLLESGGMLVICHDDFMGEMEPFVEWKNQKGIPTEIVPVSQVGQDPQAIKEYVRSYYDQHEMGYLLLVGDHDQIPTFDVGSDPVHSLLRGDDSYPEIFVGRFSAENPAQAQTQVDRTITYEKYPDPDGDWYHMGLGDADTNGPCNGEQYDFQHITNIALDLVRWNYTQVDSVYTTFYGTTEMISAFLNEGRSIFNYAGHGGIQTFGPVDFTNDDIDALVNDNMLPHFVAVACFSGNFENYTCVGEAWLRATNDVTGEPTGAIAAYLSIAGQSWFPPYDMQDEGVDLLCADSVLTFGGMCFNGSGLMMDLWPVMGPYEFKNWTIFGDPSVYLRSTTPYTLTVAHDQTLRVGTSSFNVSVSGPGGPLEGAAVCGMNDEVYASGLTDATGQVTLNYDPAPVIPEPLILTVTAANAIPYIAEVDIITGQDYYIIFNDLVINDETGNNNQLLDLGEDVLLSITVENAEPMTAYDINASISTEDLYIALLDSVEMYPVIPGGSTAVVEDGFELFASDVIPDQHPVDFLLTATDGDSTWITPFSITAHAPILQYEGLVIDDSTGNGNNHLDPGETADFHIYLMNDGSGDANDVTVFIFCMESMITIPQDTTFLSLLAAGTEEIFVIPGIYADSSFSVEDSAHFSLDITTSRGYTTSAEFAIMVGDHRYEPSGPDSYGYYAYDKYDGAEAPEYVWLEIAPAAGGSGTLLELGAYQHDCIPLPFPFRLYGVEYTEATICASGWISFDTCSFFYPLNLPIPDEFPPDRLIAPFWDALDPGEGGQVCYHYDPENHHFVVEWYQAEHIQVSDSLATFQVVLYDPIHYPTVTGDGEIIMNYQTVSALTNSCTVGIEDSSGTTGMQYLCNGTYDDLAIPLEDNFTIKFTTGSIPMDIGPSAFNPTPVEFSLSQNFPNPFNPSTTIWFGLPEAGPVELTLYNISGQQVATMIDGYRQAGYHEVTLEAAELSSGLYFFKLQAGDFMAVKKMVLVK